MELWFWAAVTGMAFAGVSNFIFKIAAVRQYDGSRFSFVGATAMFIVLLLIVLLFSEKNTLNFVLFGTGVMAGAFGGLNNILKVKVLQCIDSTIYFPLFKLLSPIIAIVLGLLFFGESFTYTEWIGLLLGIFVPLLLISPGEKGRQKNLALGLIIVVVTASFAAFGSALGKYTVTLLGDVIFTTLLMTTGVLLGSVGAEYSRGGYTRLEKLFHIPEDRTFIVLSILRSILITIGAGMVLLAYYLGGPLAIVHTINSLYILIPIMLSIIYYGEHWNAKKVIAIILSVAALVLFQ